MQELGFNYRMTDIQAALGIEQLKKNDEWIKIRRGFVTQYDESFTKIGQVKPQQHPDINGGYSYHLYILQCEKRAELYHLKWFSSLISVQSIKLDILRSFYFSFSNYTL